MAGGTHIPIWTGRAGATLFARPEGPCTVAICETLDSGLRRLAGPDVRDVCIDLSRADWLDSTFTGFLVALATRGRLSGKHICLLQPTQAARKCLDQMHVFELFDIRDRLEPGPTTWEQLPSIEPQGADMTRRVIDSHEQLIEADARNEPAFAPVVDLFRKRAESSEP